MALTNFAGSVAVITGGASGIGLATGSALRARGAHIVLADINEAALLKAQEQLNQGNPGAQGQVLTVPGNVTSETQMKELMQQALDACGSIDLVVTCAGVGFGGPIDTFSADEMQSMMNINFMGTFLCVQAALPAMRRQASGHFVFLSSIAGKLGPPLLSGYCASKWAVRGFSAALRAELYGSGIGITTVYPAWVDTPMIHQEAGGALRLPNVQALLTPEQVASEILQAVIEGRRDLTLVPNPDIALALQIFNTDQDKAEDVMGKSLQRQLAKMSNQP
ncbi:MAG TPA: SDR family oxidoreductase [Ktedonobacteraceae bacterium]|nr:SDR family oxidoreductase [Ktedonobacteraceae bacterium]